MKDTKYFKDKREYCTRQKLSRNMKDAQVF